MTPSHYSNSFVVSSGVNEPDMSDLVYGIAGEDNAAERVETIAGDTFDAANSTVGTSEAQEAALRAEADEERVRARQVRKERRAVPETTEVESAERLVKPNWWMRCNGFLALAFLLALFVPIPALIAQGIAESQTLIPIARDWRLGLPVGIAPLAGIIASSLLRHTLTARARTSYDRFISVAGIGALGLWAAGYAVTFLVPLDGSGTFGGSASHVDLRPFYAIHLGLEVIAALGLTAIVERSFAAGRRVVRIVNEGVDLLTERAEATLARLMSLITDADTVKDRRDRLAAARRAYIAKQLALLTRAQMERAAAMAAAAAKSTRN
ncbi:hypothetical protein [Minwuia sp.]|uniref:hypothetical protein n=1 Tax=Minwuia sp. TaxID=2493630 RepID=UPI003A8F7A28